jgi:hypothetical protein
MKTQKKQVKESEQDTKAGKAKDRFGFTIGSQPSTICAFITTKPKTMQELVKEAGLKGTFYQKLSALVKAKQIKKDGKVYTLKGKVS